MQEKQQRRIQRLQKQVAQQITSQQIIPTLHQCIKELIDNAIDATATIIKIQLQQYGKVTFSVYDNGTGIRQVEKLGQGGNTSKLSNQQNYLGDIRTLGFRGQAINSIANLCKQMTIQTVFQQQSSLTSNQPRFTEVNYSVTQRLIIDKKPSLSSNTFTKITVQSLFYNIPVRKYQLENKPKQSLKKVYELLFEISLIFPQITFILINFVEGKQQLLFEAQRYTSKIKRQQYLHQNYFGKDISQQAWRERIQLCFPQKLDDCLQFVKEKNIEGFILNTIDSGSSKKNLKFPKNLQYTFINRRPVNPLKQVCRIFDSYYKKYNPYTKYVFFLNIKIEPHEIDINLSPNKRDIFIKKERLDDILKQIKYVIEKEVIEKITNLEEYKEAKLKKIESKSVKKKQENNGEANERSSSQFLRNNQKAAQSQFQDSFKIRQQVFTSHVSQKRQERLLKGNYLANYQKANPLKNSSTIEELNRRISTATVGLEKRIHLDGDKMTKNIIKEEEQQKLGQHEDKQQQDRQINSQSQDQEQDKFNHIEEQKIQISKIPLKVTDQLKTSIFHSLKQSFASKPKDSTLENNNKDVIMDKGGQKHKQQVQNVKVSGYQIQDNIKKEPNKDKLIQNNLKPEYHRNFNLQHYQSTNHNVNSKLLKKQEEPQCCSHLNTQNKSVNTEQNNQQNYDIKIEDFEIPDNINYITEQNRGQITKKDFKNFHIHGQFNKGFILCSFKEKNYLYIIDQHASEQKSFFESFMESEPIFYYLSKEIELTPIQVDQIQMARQQLNKSGFTFNIKDRTTLKLMRCPSYFKKNFGLQQFMQIAESRKNIKELPSFYNSAASKACRTAVMIGDELGKNRMIGIVQKMSDLKSPWNCPHGRPSLISLGSFESTIRKIKAKKQSYKF